MSESIEAAGSNRFAATKRVSVSSPLLGDQSIAYYDDGGTGPVVVFVHPNSCSTESWEHQLADTLPMARPTRWPRAGAWRSTFRATA
ncbi:MAG: alpha/beta hydrolase [Sandaracinaceae bacterium]|nr:alpha/beta hydrolase [Sandaracinaceae bacterium]